ncbi:hypothetical protein V5799_002742 [Amblyomma americanum]|uniref:Uncharacterized protein n=1 Tax=Amblyomma americanum TaxID=6943 RepID=A0AAQ4DAY9_AMBAM
MGCWFLYKALHIESSKRVFYDRIVLGGEAFKSTEPLTLKELCTVGDSELHSQETTEQPLKRFKMQRLLVCGFIFLICVASLMPSVCGCNAKLRKTGEHRCEGRLKFDDCRRVVVVKVSLEKKCSEEPQWHRPLPGLAQPGPSGRDCGRNGYCGYGPCSGCVGNNLWCAGYCTM